ncbi:hypothetical protein [Paracraurococcus lichenis]|uniref:Fe-S oxidoreductase n=1 Tax=Paracraurococcus lichenis TaxID=3064888 RepID=A0ABT9DYT8_9PROT|nr:hypothetical protein [Paracraurococcus sp. LOR1-02]MDO9709073.1 hypothetical protein [Paracraurococcus sp. LOR1-02]
MRARPRALLRGAALLLLLAPGAALAQGQESVVAPMGPQTSAHPPPLLSSAAATAVPSGPVIPPKPVAAPVPETRGGGLVLPGMVRLASPARLACDEIGDRTARRRCEGLKAPPAPPAGSAP